MSPRDAVTAVRRFGLGARPGELKKVASDPRGYVLASLSAHATAQMPGKGLPSTDKIYADVRSANEQRRNAKAAGGNTAPAPPEARAPRMPGAMKGEGMEAMGVRKGSGERTVSPGEVLHRAYVADATARITHARTTDAAFFERLMMFWSNHFCVGGGKGRLVGIVGSYEREAIRPLVLGRFSDMLLAVAQHPAMLMYLDNITSMGPNSSIGLRQKKGLNENLAREILELHTLGVDGGYTQADVANLARLITGWSVTENRFAFLPAWHEPGTWTVLGKAYTSGDVEVGRKCLLDVARHPSTARFVARKLATHFVADNPSPALVQGLTATFQRTDGDLSAVAKALVAAPEAWHEPSRKSLPPYDWSLAVARGFNLALQPAEVMRIANTLGQPLWKPNSPKGFPDSNDAWIGAPAVREKLRVAELLVRDIDKALDPRAAAESLLGAAMSPQTKQAIARAETREQGFEILMMSPDFQRR
jgi:uncharacterized protein (DUF1800 family)